MRDNTEGGALTETSLLVLLAFCRPSHGYEVMQFIERETGGRVMLGAGTLYGAINSLLEKQWIQPGAHRPDKRNKKIYHITPLGREKIQGEIRRLAALEALARKMEGCADEET